MSHFAAAASCGKYPVIPGPHGAPETPAQSGSLDAGPNQWQALGPGH